MSNIQPIADFCHKLSSSKTSFEVSQRAFAEFAPHYHLAKINVFTDTPQSIFAKEEGGNGPVYVSEEAKAGGELGIPLSRTYDLDGQGTLTIDLYPGAAPWTEDEARELDVFADVCFFYFGRVRFMQVMKRTALTQFLTGFPNAGGFIAHISMLLSRKKLSEYDAFYFNLKGFGLISKKLGQANGDQVMKMYADTLRSFPEGDEIIGHLGGDNYVALILKNRTPQFLELISGVEVKGVFNNRSYEFLISAVAGGWHIDDSASDPGEVLSYTAIALNVARNVIHQPVCFVTQEMLDQVNHQKWILEHFGRAIAKQEFQVYYQPKVDSRTKQLVGAEGLVRWRHGDRLIPPGEFVPVLEREGEIPRLDLYMLEHVCMDIKRWEADGLDPVQVSVNISRRDLSIPNLAEEIRSMIDRYGIDKRLIQIEVTETVDEQEHGLMTSFLQNLWVMKISTAIDDFGSGYSSLSTLRNFQISMLKIDRSFINNDTFSENDEIILTDIIHMANQLGIEVITEGVERPDQLDFVNKVGCYLIQGYLYDKPLPEPEFRERLARKDYE